MKKLFVLGGVACMAFAAASGHAQKADGVPTLVQRSAVKLPVPTKARILGATRAGARIVAVGDRGTILLSDDDGKSYRQAKTVPTRAALTSVSFVDERHGWAVGHWGVILNTQDGGETWALQRDDLGTDQPLFSVWFKNRNEGLAAGLFSLLLKTEDGGKTWSAVSLPPPEGAKRFDANLFRIFSGRNGTIYIAGEQGLVLVSGDGGMSWNATRTGNKGTFWAGIALDDGTLLVAGLRGKIYRSVDEGKTWESVESGTQSSITDLVQLPDRRVFATALDGISLESVDRGRSFKARQHADQRALTALAAPLADTPILFSEGGVVKD